MIKQPPRIDTEDELALAKLVAKYALLPHPSVVREVRNPVFPTLRVNRELRNKTTECGRYVGDDNKSPRWALLWAHGFKRQTVASGWQVAHIWERAKDPAAFTQLANLAFVPKSLTRLTDDGGAAAAFLRWHSAHVYQWAPTDAEIGAAPLGYSEIDWNYLPRCNNPREVIEERRASQDCLMLAINKLST